MDAFEMNVIMKFHPSGIPRPEREKEQSSEEKTNKNNNNFASINTVNHQIEVV